MSQTPTIEKRNKAEMSFVEHLEVLRWHIIRAGLVWVVFAILIFIRVDWVFDHIIFAPAQNDFITYRGLCRLGAALGLGESLCMPPIRLELLGNTVSGPFMAAVSISMVGALIVAFPFLIWEMWRFVKPALSSRELAYARSSIFWVSLCFLLGASFGYFLLAPFTFNFLANFTLGTMGSYRYMPTLNDYIDTLNNIILGCGLAFELPVLAYVLTRIGLITGAFLRQYRRYAFVGILLLAAIITPSPDWTSQLIVAVPLLLLYEISILIALRVDRDRKKEEVRTWS